MPLILLAMLLGSIVILWFVVRNFTDTMDADRRNFQTQTKATSKLKSFADKFGLTSSDLDDSDEVDGDGG